MSLESPFTPLFRSNWFNREFTYHLLSNLRYFLCRIHHPCLVIDEALASFSNRCSVVIQLSDELGDRIDKSGDDASCRSDVLKSSEELLNRVFGRFSSIVDIAVNVSRFRIPTGFFGGVDQLQAEFCHPFGLI